jgi:hypothetical protein
MNIFFEFFIYPLRRRIVMILTYAFRLNVVSRVLLGKMCVCVRRKLKKWKNIILDVM